MAINAFLKFEEPDIEGECTATGHEKEIQVLSWSHSFNQPTSPTRSSAGSGTVEQANHSDLSFTKYTDSASDDLLKMCWSGKQIGKGTLQLYRADGENNPVKYLEIVMEKVVVSNFSIGGGSGDVPTETVSLNYGKVQYNYIPQKQEDGTSGGNEPVTHDLMTEEVS
ncbi:MAG: type VI secretion system tube protein Hcp [Rhodospirillales bacterium]|nr:MAG: type VI secretion system tube protein Hcp [Rhodospirillales bacterium]